MNQQEYRTNYSIHWAYAVAKDFRRKYARATYMIQKVYDFDDELVAVWLCSYQERWRNYKKTVKMLSKWVDQQERVGQLSAEVLHICVVEVIEKLKKDMKRGNLEVLGLDSIGDPTPL
ncbi:hypothetical protein ES703_114200 [subsurface metagenome]